jgi:ferric-dicitrate binding protein FerR (iron transport regulator)
MDQKEYIKKWIEETLTDDERKIFEQTDTFKSLTKITESLQVFKAPEFSLEGEWEKLQSKRSGKGRSARLIWFNPLTRIAAIFIVLLGIYYFFFHNTRTTIQTNFTENKELLLPDSSMVVLNAQSHISYFKNKWMKEREIILDGEAFFKVQEGSRFEVKTETGIVSVLGTQFNVKSRLDYFEVICYEGLVRVQSHNENLELPPHHMFRVLNGKITRISDISSQSPSWISNVSSFQSVPFIQVIREFERQYNVTITTVNVDLDQLYTGGFVNNDLNIALQSIAIPLNLDYQNIRNQKIVLSAKSN